MIIYFFLKQQLTVVLFLLQSWFSMDFQQQRSSLLYLCFPHDSIGLFIEYIAG